MMMLFVLIALGLSYLVGSFCSAVFVSNLCHLPDPRTEGSQNPGATNVLRLSGKKYAAVVLFFDMLKGFVPVVCGQFLGASPFVLGLIGLAAVLGHMFPLFYEFKGGKGVATALGVVFGLSPFLGFLCSLIWLVTAKLTHYASLASIVAISVIPVFSLFSENRTAILPLLIMAGFVLYKHRDNIMRLKNHEESQLKM